MKQQRTSCRVVINPIFGNESIKQIIASRGSQLEKRRRMEEIVTQIEKQFDDLDTLMKKSPSATPKVLTKPRRASIRSRLTKGEDLMSSLKFMRPGEVNKSVLSACSLYDAM